MASVLEDLVKDRQRGANTGGQRTVQSKATEVLRFVSMVVMAAAVLHYHEQLFSAAQPWVNRLYELMRH